MFINYFTESGIYLDENVIYDLTSPNYPDDYPNDGDYDWKFRTSSRFIVINILDFETESGYDFETIEGPGLKLGDLGERKIVTFYWNDAHHEDY